MAFKCSSCEIEVAFELFDQSTLQARGIEADGKERHSSGNIYPSIYNLELARPPLLRISGADPSFSIV